MGVVLGVDGVGSPRARLRRVVDDLSKAMKQYEAEKKEEAAHNR